MTVIAWDGKWLAADKQSTDVGLRRTTTKIRIAQNGNLMGASGDSGVCEALRLWYDAGAKPADFPDKDKSSRLLVIDKTGQPWFYDANPTPIRFEGQRFAMGSGRDYAETAMYLGKNAREAVEIASLFDINCGQGVDVLGFSWVEVDGKREYV